MPLLSTLNSFPQRSHVERESAQQRLARDGLGVFQDFDLSAGAVDVDLPGGRVEQPPQLRAVFDVLLHLLLQPLQRVGQRAQLHDEVRADRRKSLALLTCKRLPPLLLDPSEIRRSLRAVRQGEECGRVEAFTRSVLPCPYEETTYQLEVAIPRLSSGRWHDNEVSFAAEFDVEVFVEHAEVIELVLVPSSGEVEHERLVSLLSRRECSSHK